MSETYAGPIVAVDLGATTLAVAAVRNGEIVARETVKTPKGPTGQAVTDTILETVDAALDTAGIDASDVEGVGVGSIGPLDAAAGVVISPPNLSSDIEGIPLAGPLGDHLDAPVDVENDAIAGLIGERAQETDPPENMAYVTLSTGIGAGVAVDGRVLRGWGGNAAEVGHFVLDPEGTVTCGCGRDGHWEAFAGGANIPRYARSLTDEFEGETDLPLEDPDFDAKDVFSLAGEDVLADIVIHRLERWNALGIANLIHAYAPEIVSIGGSVALHNTELVIDPLRERLPPLITSRVPEIRETPLGADAVLHGAIELGRRAGETAPDSDG